MSQWGNTDNAANSVIWVGPLAKTTANAATRTALFGNTTAGAYVTNLQTGQVGISADEMISARAGGAPKPAHAGWALRTRGTGGRANRVQYEVLVASGSIGGDALDDALLPDFAITITRQPLNTSVAAGGNGVFTVLASRVPTDTALGYAWSYANGDVLLAGANVGPTNTSTLTVNSTVQTSNANFIVTITTAGATTVVSNSARLTITV
jgi:hypothetical protein